jgi:hypothetical protein
MSICEFCVRQSADGSCRLGLNVPKTMRCREFEPGMEKFCANPADFAGPAQILEMARFFGLNGKELKKVKIVVERRVVERAEELS